ncbi:MAG: DNA polymerase III subunit delta, partial [Bacteroidetes bacterium]
VSYLEKPFSSTSLALVASKTDFRQKVFDVLKKNALLVECKTPYPNEMSEWIQKRVKKLGKTIGLEASALLIGRTANSLRVIQSEIEKLFIYVGDKGEISVEDVEEVVGISKQFNIFELQKALGSSNIGKSLEILEHMLDSGESAIGMNVLLTKYFQKIQLVHEFRSKKLNDFSLANSLGISSKFVGEYLQAAKNYSAMDIELCFRHLLEADEALKFSADEKVTMTMLLYKILKKVKTAQYETI